MNKPPHNDTHDDKWIQLAAAARNVRAYLLLRKEAGSDDNRTEASEPAVPPPGEQSAEENEKNS